LTIVPVKLRVNWVSDVLPAKLPVLPSCGILKSSFTSRRLLVFVIKSRVKNICTGFPGAILFQFLSKSLFHFPGSGIIFAVSFIDPVQIVFPASSVIQVLLFAVPVFQCPGLLILRPMRLCSIQESATYVAFAEFSIHFVFLLAGIIRSSIVSIIILIAPVKRSAISAADHCCDW
jgi:hypothetical protein